MKEFDRLNREQPGRFRNLTRDGFKVVPVPEPLLTELRRFHERERLRLSVPEERHVALFALSGLQSDNWLLPLSPQLAQLATDTLRPILADWTGLQPEHLVSTATYGIRLYRNNSLQHWHVDRAQTHAISAIIQVAHLPIGKLEDPATRLHPWPLHVLDHHGQPHVILDGPGFMLLYESATCAHARPQAFYGREYANMFVHFAPKGWPEAYYASGQRTEL